MALSISFNFASSSTFYFLRFSVLMEIGSWFNIVVTSFLFRYRVSRVAIRSDSGSTFVPTGLFFAAFSSNFISYLTLASSLYFWMYFGVLPQLGVLGGNAFCELKFSWPYTIISSIWSCLGSLSNSCLLRFSGLGALLIPALSGLPNPEAQVLPKAMGARSLALF